MCRTKIPTSSKNKPRIDNKTKEKIITSFPERFGNELVKLREKQEIAKEIRLKGIDIIIEYGNLHTKLEVADSNKHSWTYFVKLLEPNNIFLE